MKRTLPHNWPLYASIILLLVVVWLTLRVSVSQNHGHLVYTLDDAYIHMAMAKNFSQSGVWGVTRYGYTPTSSSLLWTLLLGLTYYLGGVSELAPLLWNLVFAVVVLAVTDAILSWYKSPAWVRLVTLASIVLLVPLPTLILSGMEQTLQTLIVILTVFLSARLLSGESPGSARRDALWLLIVAPLVTAVRFEGMFLIVFICGLGLLRKRWLYAITFAVCGFLPVVINASISVSKGWFLFPTSVLMKASLPDFHSPGALILSLLNPFYVALREGPHVLVLLVSVILVYIMASEKGSGAWESRQIMSTILFLTGMAHLEFVGTSRLYRYDAYWCALAFLIVGLQLPVIVPRGHWLLSSTTWITPRNLAAGALSLLFFFMLAQKGGRVLWLSPQCTTNIYEQQYQMGLFVRRYYQNSTVALNDIGAVNFFADIHCLDLYGLANAEVAASRRKHRYQAPDLDRIAKKNGARIAIIYDDWFSGLVPRDWIRIGRWTIPNNVIAGDSTVSFYALDPSEAAHLSASLGDFYSQLPIDVTQRGQ